MIPSVFKHLMILGIFLNEVTQASQESTIIKASTAAIKFSDGWTTKDESPFTNKKGAVATFNFNGTHIQVVGSLSLEENTTFPDPKATFEVDTDKSTAFRNDHNGSSNMLYSSPTMLNGQHQLKMTNLNPQRLTVDHFVVVSPGSSSSKATPAGTNSATETATSSLPQRKKIPIGVIVGPIVSVVLLGLLAAGLIYYRRGASRHRWNLLSGTLETSSLDTEAPRPFPVGEFLNRTSMVTVSRKQSQDSDSLHMEITRIQDLGFMLPMARPNTEQRDELPLHTRSTVVPSYKSDTIHRLPSYKSGQTSHPAT